MLLPFWTDGCIGSMEGLYFEASATTPFHFLNEAELSRGAVEPGARPARAADALQRLRPRQGRRSTCSCWA